MPRATLASRVTFLGGFDLGLVRRAEIREHFGIHAVLILDFTAPRGGRRPMVPEGSPVRFRWGLLPLQGRTFYGYVNHHEITDGQETPNLLRVYCVGSSLPLNQPHPQSWVHVSPSYVAAQIAARHHLRAFVHKGKEVLEYWTQGNETDLEMLNRLAERTGYRFWIDGSTLYFLDPERLVRLPRATRIPTLVMDRHQSDSLHSLEIIAGSLAPRPEGGPATREIFGLNKHTGGLIKATSAKAMADRGLARPERRVMHGLAVKDADEARRVSEASAVLGRWVTILANTKGNSGIRVGDVVRISGRAVHEDYQGLWLVDGATHVITDRLSTDLNLSRNQADRAYFATTSSLAGAPRRVQAVLRSGKYWESEILETVYA